MIVVRNIFRLKFGQAKPALALWRDGRVLMTRLNPRSSSRVLTDVVGPSYTMVYEDVYENISAFEQAAQVVMGNAEWRAWYAKFVPLVESGSREIFTIVE